MACNCSDDTQYERKRQALVPTMDDGMGVKPMTRQQSFLEAETGACREGPGRPLVFQSKKQQG